MTCISESTISKSLTTLEEDGWINISNGKGRKRTIVALEPEFIKEFKNSIDNAAINNNTFEEQYSNATSPSIKKPILKEVEPISKDNLSYHNMLGNPAYYDNNKISNNNINKKNNNICNKIINNKNNIDKKSFLNNNSKVKILEKSNNSTNIIKEELSQPEDKLVELNTNVSDSVISNIVGDSPKEENSSNRTIIIDYIKTQLGGTFDNIPIELIDCINDKDSYLINEFPKNKTEEERYTQFISMLESLKNRKEVNIEELLNKQSITADEFIVYFNAILFNDTINKNELFTIYSLLRESEIKKLNRTMIEFVKDNTSGLEKT